MKFIPLFCFFLLLSFQSIAQLDRDRLYYAHKVEKFRRLKSTGTKLTVAGGILVITGISMIINGTKSTNYGGTTQTTVNSTANNGALIWLAGIASLGTGIPLWIVGGHQQSKYERRFENLSLGFNLTPQNTGLTLTVRF